MIVLFIDRGFPFEPFAEALAGEIDCRPEVGPEEAGDVVAIVTGAPPVGPADVAPYPNLRLVLTCSIGTDHLDVEGLRALGLTVANTPTYCTHEVAQHALACTLSGLRGVPRLAAAVRAGTWDYAVAGVPLRFEDATLGIVGLGRIGRALGALAQAVGMTVLAHDPYAAGGETPLDELLERSDVVSLHAPGGSGLLLGEREIARMRPRAVLVNVARPDLADLDATVAALRAGRLGAAYWDVWPQEPADPGDPRLQTPGLVVTPHAAWHSARADQAYRDEAVAALREVLLSGS